MHTTYRLLQFIYLYIHESSSTARDQYKREERTERHVQTTPWSDLWRVSAITRLGRVINRAQLFSGDRHELNLRMVDAHAVKM